MNDLQRGLFTAWGCYTMSKHPTNVKILVNSYGEQCLPCLAAVNKASIIPRHS